MSKSLFIWLIILTIFLTGCQKLVFVRDTGSSKKIFEMEGDGDSQQNVSLPNTADYTYPSISPDGSEIAYTDGQKIYISMLGDIGGSTQHELAPDSSNSKRLLKWSPDKQVIAYTEMSAGKGTIFLAATNGVAPLQATFPTSSQSDIGQDFYLNNNSQHLVFSRNGDLYTQYFNGTQPATQITNTPNIKESLPTVSNDLRFLAYRTSFQLTPTGAHDAISIVDVGTWQPRYGIVLPSPVKQGSISSIAFSCDDKRLFVGAEKINGAGDRHEIFSVKLDGSNLKQLTNNNVYDSQPSAQVTPCR